MKVSELLSKCVNCDYSRTRVAIWDGKRFCVEFRTGFLNGYRICMCGVSNWGR